MANKPKMRSFGTVTELPSGKFRARYTGPDGRKHSAPHTFIYDDDAVAWLSAERRLIDLDAWTPPKSRIQIAEDKARTVGQWLTEWLELRTRGTNPLKESTHADYQRTLDRRILNVGGKAARLRDITLIQLTRRDVAAWWDAINAQFDSAPYNHNAFLRLHTALEAAVEREIIEINPAKLPSTARRARSVRKQLPEDEVIKGIIEQLDRTVPRVDGDRKLVAILTLAHGVRIGEALGAQRKDFIKLGDRWSFHVGGNVYREPGKGMIYQDRAKTDAGNRVVPIFQHYNDDVEYHLEHFTGPSADAFLFTGPTGKIVMDTSYRSIMNRAKERAGFKDVIITPHYGRVWLITTLVEAGMPIPAIGEILGQTDLRTITEIYMRATADRKRQVLDDVNRRLEGLPDGVVDINAKRASQQRKDDVSQAE
ncbi:tyrosine-type recombinase/integrase [Corynebacterium cystitidis]|uniref:tyrosine-type recombinase/integrase n=1 Tax=Corynebacterium cystitidis TaxID=35757 RepID=UPI00211E564A|nr:site-specific integrase [Corynebacterium cystitidis]